MTLDVQVYGRNVEVTDRIFDYARKKVSKLRGKLSYRFSHELGMSMAEIGRYLGVCTSAVCKAIQYYEADLKK